MSVLCFYLGLLSFRGQTKIKQEVHRISLVTNLLVSCYKLFLLGLVVKVYWVTDPALEILLGRLTRLTIPIPIKIPQNNREKSETKIVKITHSVDGALSEAAVLSILNLVVLLICMMT